MLYLILPPIIIVVSLIALVYFFSRRFSQVNEVLSEKSLGIDAPELADAGILISFKSASIRIMERIAHWFKESSQRAHEKLQSLSQDVKDRKDKSALHMKKTLHHVQTARQLKQERKIAKEVSSVKASSAIESMPEESYKETEKSTDIARVSKRNDRFQALKNVVSKVRDLPKKEGRVARMRPMVSQKITQPEEKIIQETPVEEEELAEAKNQLEDILVERIAANPRDLEAYERLGEYYMEQGNVQDAKECYRQVLRLSPVHRLAKIKIRRLEKMLEQK